MFPTGFNEYNGGYDYYLEHKKPEIVEKTVKADSENKAAYKENKKNKADDRKRRAKLLSLQREMDSLEAEIATLKAEAEKPDVSSDYQKLSDILALIADKESCLEDAETLRDMLAEEYGAKVELITDIGPVIGAHTGPGVISLCSLSTKKGRGAANLSRPLFYVISLRQKRYILIG